jgi:hypothetical protein
VTADFFKKDNEDSKLRGGVTGGKSPANINMTQTKGDASFKKYLRIIQW